MPGSDILRVLREELITTVTLPPTVLAALSAEELYHLQTIIAAGGGMTAEIVERWYKGRRFLDACTDRQKRQSAPASESARRVVTKSQPLGGQ